MRIAGGGLRAGGGDRLATGFVLAVQQPAFERQLRGAQALDLGIAFGERRIGLSDPARGGRERGLAAFGVGVGLLAQGRRIERVRIGRGGLRVGAGEPVQNVVQLPHHGAGDAGGGAARVVRGRVAPGVDEARLHAKRPPRDALEVGVPDHGVGRHVRSGRKRPVMLERPAERQLQRLAGQHGRRVRLRLDQRLRTGSRAVDGGELGGKMAEVAASRSGRASSADGRFSGGHSTLIVRPRRRGIGGKRRGCRIARPLETIYSQRLLNSP